MLSESTNETTVAISPSRCPGLSCREGMLRWAKRQVASIEDAEDICGEICMHCTRGMRQFRGEAEFKTWLYRIARNVLSDFLRAKRTRQELSATDLDLARKVASRAAASTNPSMDSDMEEVQSALRALSPRQRHLIEWKYGDGLTYAEIAARLQISNEAASQALYRARGALRRAILLKGSEGN